MSLPEWVFLIDGECTLCSYFGIAVNRFDHASTIKYATQQSELGMQIAKDCGVEGEIGKSVLFVNTKQQRAYLRSDAILQAARVVRQPWLTALAYAGACIPKGVRDAIYEFVSARRHAWFGTAPCKLPPAKYRNCVLN